MNMIVKESGKKVNLEIGITCTNINNNIKGFSHSILELSISNSLLIISIVNKTQTYQTHPQLDYRYIRKSTR